MLSSNVPPRGLRRFVPAALLCVGGGGLVLGANIWFWTSLLGGSGSLVQVPIPGSVSIEFETAGEYEVIFETAGTLGGVPYRAARPSAEPLVTLVDINGSVTAVRKTAIESSYSIFGAEGRTLGVLDVPASGKAVLTVADTDPINPSGGTVIVKTPFSFGRLVLLLVAVVIGSVAAMSGLVLGLVRVFRR